MSTFILSFTKRFFFARILPMSKGIRKIWKKFWSPILHSPVIQWPLVVLLATTTWFVFLTSRHKFTNTASLKQYRHKPAVFVFFHGRCAMLSPVIKSAHVKSYCIASRHQDGHMMARLQRLFGLRAIYGSTSNGGVAVLRDGVRVMRDKNISMCISVDGPSGPSMHVYDGALYFAKMTGAPIVPCCFSCSRPIYLDRWDKFMIPKLFGTVSVNIGDPIYIDSNLRGAEFEQKRQGIEEIMVKQLRDMDNEFKLPETPRGIHATEYKKHSREKRCC